MSPDTALESVEYDPEEDKYRVTYDPETPPSVAVPSAMQEITGKEVWELDPLHAVIDPDALDEVFQPPRGTVARRNGRVTFAYQNHSVTVFSDRRLVVESSDDQKPNSAPNR